MDYLNLTYNTYRHSKAYNLVLNKMADDVINKLKEKGYSQRAVVVADGVIIQIWLDDTKYRIDLPSIKDCLYITIELMQSIIFNLNLGIPLSTLHNERN